MNEKLQNCPKCGGTMTEGFMMGHVLGTTAFPEHWHPGVPQCNVFGGTQVEKEKLIPIRSFRCEQCGFLEQYTQTQ